MTLKYEAFQQSYTKPAVRQVSTGESIDSKQSKISNNTNNNTYINRKSGPCFYCGKKGHISKECRKRQRDNEDFLRRNGNSHHQHSDNRRHNQNVYGPQNQSGFNQNPLLPPHAPANQGNFYTKNQMPVLPVANQGNV